MALSSNLISEFVKITKDDAPKKSEATVYATVVKSDGSTYVKFDGSELLTPVTSTTNVEDGERVTVMIKNHEAIVTGNISSPSARTAEVEDVSSQVENIKIVVADKVSTAELEAQIARINTLEATDVTVSGNLTAVTGRIENLETDNTTIKDTLTANEASIKKLEAEDVTINGKLSANEADIKDLKAEDVTINGKLSANEADINTLKTDKLSATDAEIKYANINFANIGEAAIKKLFADYGLIKDLVVSSGHITGELVGVTIKGDLIEGNTVKADKLVVKGSDGIYYKLNFEAGQFASGEPVPTDTLHGSVITANSITATKINVDDLVAFDATIGGFNISDDSIYSGVKESINNTTRGIYLKNDGQIAFGDGSNFIKYYKDANGNYKLAVSAETIEFSASGTSVKNLIEDANTAASNAQTTANAANTAASNAQSTANAANTTAQNAQTTANAANTTAQNAQDTAGAAQEAAFAAQTSADNAGDAAAEAVRSIGEIPNRVKIEKDGIHLRDENGVSAMKINSASVSIGTSTSDGKEFSQFAANYVQFGNYQMRRTADGGLAFKLTEVI